MNTAGADIGGAGTQTAAIRMGGQFQANSELYNGSSWTATANINTARYNAASAGTQAAALIAGGSPNSSATTTATEEFTAGGTTITTVTTS